MQTSMATGLLLGATAGCVQAPPALPLPSSSSGRAESTGVDLPSPRPTRTTGPSSTTTAANESSTSSSGGLDSSSGLNSSGTPPPGDAMVRFVHLMVGGPSFEISSDEQPSQIAVLEPGDTVFYTAWDAVPQTFRFIPTSGTPDDPPQVTASVELAPDTSYTVIALGHFGRDNDLTAPTTITLIDDASGLAPDNIRLSFVHAAPATGTFDLWDRTDDNSPLLLETDIGFANSFTLPDRPAGAIELAIDLDLDGDPEFSWSANASPAAGRAINLYLDNDRTGDLSLQVHFTGMPLIPLPIRSTSPVSRSEGGSGRKASAMKPN